MSKEYSFQIEVFNYAVSHFPNVMHTLSSIEKLNQKTMGLEGWFKIELIKALEQTDIIEKVNNKGPSLKLKNDTYLELKAGADLNFTYILKGVKQCPCLFLGKPRGKRESFMEEDVTLEFKKRDGVEIIIERFQHNWNLGLLYNIS
jgi:hypothetical protein